MNRINLFIIIFISFILSFLVVFLFLQEIITKDPEVIIAPFQIEVYRIDRKPLPDADIYLNQRFIGKTDERGFYSKDINLIVGESYALRIERDSKGYVYGPWETHFKVEEEKKRLREKKQEDESSISSLEGESDILTELERAQLGKASIYEKYHFLAFVDGNMYYSIRVSEENNDPIKSAAVFINGKEEGLTDDRGTFIVKYSGEDIRRDNIQVIKEGEHIWMDEVLVKPDAYIDVKPHQMILVELRIYTENYDVLKGVEDAKVYFGQEYLGETDEEGLFSFKYINEDGVDGYLELIIDFPQSYLPEKLKKVFVIKRDLPKLNVTNFTYSKDPVLPKIAVMPFIVESNADIFLKKRAYDLKVNIEDYFSSSEDFITVQSKMISEMFRKFNISYTRENIIWKDIPLIKKELDAIIVGKVGGSGNNITVDLNGFDYTGEKIFDLNKTVSLREFQFLSEEVVYRFKNNFPIEGNISAIDKKIYVNLGKRHGVKNNNLFYGFTDYYDEIKKDYSKRRVVKLKIVETSGTSSAGDIEDINEGYLLEPGVKVKRYAQGVDQKKEIPLYIRVLSNRKPLADVNVYLDDHWFGQTNDEGKLKLSVDSNINIDFLVYKEGYIPKKESIKVDENTGELRFVLEQGQTSLRISSEPEGALIFIDGEFKGTTPIKEKPIVVPYGFHLVELELEGYTKYKEYIKFSERKLTFSGDNSIVLFPDYLSKAEREYELEKITATIELLDTVPADHPDYLEAMEFIGYIYLNDLKDFEKSIDYYKRSLESLDNINIPAKNIFSYYNLAQAYFNYAEKNFYKNPVTAIYNYQQAITNFDYVRGMKARIPARTRVSVYQDILFYIAVSYQKLYYLTLKNDSLNRAYFSWNDYFDFYKDELLNDNYFRKQYYTAQSYKEEAQRLKGEE